MTTLHELFDRTRAALQARPGFSSETPTDHPLSSVQSFENAPRDIFSDGDRLAPVVTARAATQSVDVTVHALSSHDREALGTVGVKIFEALHTLADRARRHPNETVLIPVKLWALAGWCGVTDRRVRQVMAPHSVSGRVLARWVAWDAHHVLRYSEARIAGSVFAVRPLHKPLEAGQTVRITKREAQGRQWFNFVQDVRDRRTASSFPHYKQQDKTQCELWSLLLSYVDALFHPCVERNAEISRERPSGTGDLAARVYALNTGTPADEVDCVTQFARQISRSLNDIRSHRYFAKAAIAVLDRLHEGIDLREQFAAILERVMGAMREGANFRRPGAVVVKELQSWAALWGTP